MRWRSSSRNRGSRKVGPVRGKVILVLLRHNGQFFLNGFQRHAKCDFTGTPSKDKGRTQGLGLAKGLMRPCEFEAFTIPNRASELFGI